MSRAELSIHEGLAYLHQALREIDVSADLLELLEKIQTAYFEETTGKELKKIAKAHAWLSSEKGKADQILEHAARIRELRQRLQEATLAELGRTPEEAQDRPSAEDTAKMHAKEFKRLRDQLLLKCLLIHSP